MIGLDVSDRSIKVVELSDEATPRLRTICWSPLEPNVMRRGIIVNVERVTAVVRESMRKCSPFPVAGKDVTLSIAESQSFVRIVDLPFMSDSEMDEAVQWAIRQHIPFDLDRVYLDWQVLGRNDGRQEVLVGAAQREVVDPLLAAVDAAGLRVVGIELEAQALVRSLLPRDASDVNGVLIIDLGAVTTNIIFVDRGQLRFTTSIQRGGDDLTQQLAQQLQLSLEIAAEKKALVGVSSNEDPQIAAALRVATTELVREIEKVVQEITASTQGANTLRAALLVGGAANLPGLASVFSEVFPALPIQLGNPWINVILPEEQSAAPLSGSDASHFATAIGLALRPLPTPASIFYA